MIERMYSIKETAEVLRKSVKTVRRYVQQGLLSVRRSGLKSVGIPESELKQFMESAMMYEEQRLFRLVDDKLSQIYNLPSSLN